MSLWQMAGVWHCTQCGCTQVREHAMLWLPDDSLKYGRGRWVSRREREADPGLAAQCGPSGPCVWTPDPGWRTCANCGCELKGEELEAQLARENEFYGKMASGRVTFVTEIGVAVANVSGITRVDFYQGSGLKVTGGQDTPVAG